MADKARERAKMEKVFLDDKTEELLKRLMTARVAYEDLSKLSGTLRKELYDLELKKYQEELRAQKIVDETKATSSSIPQTESKLNLPEQGGHLEPWESEEKINILRDIMLKRGIPRGVFDNLGKSQRKEV